MPASAWHRYPVSAFACLWFLVGIADYLLTQVQARVYLALFTPEQVAFFTTMPALLDGLWAVGVWVGLVGAIQMLMGVAGAAVVLGIAAISFGAASAWLILFSGMVAVTGWIGIAVLLVASCIGVLIWLYARFLHRSGVIP